MTAADATMGRTSEAARPARRAWWLLLRQEIAELWLGGKALALLIVFSLLMSLTAYLVATNSELSLTPPRLMIIILLQAATSFGIFIGLAISSESFSGERERDTFEALLLTPASRRQIVAGKYLAALSPWPIAFLLAIPYILVLSQGDLGLGPALFWGALIGTLVVIFFTGVGLLVSIWSDHSRTSLFVSLMVYFLALIPAQLPGEFQTTALGALLQVSIPLEGLRQFMLRGLVDVRPVDELWPLLYAPIGLTALVLGLLFLYAAPRLRLEANSPGWWRSIARRLEGIT